MGQRRNGIRRDAARAAGRRRRRVGFAPDEPTIAAAHRRVPHLRLGRTDRVLESLIPAVLEQRVSGMDARRAWRALVTKFGDAGPGARARAHAGSAVRRGVAAHPVVGVPSRQRRPRPRPHDGRLCAARRLARAAVGRPPEQARTALMSLPGCRGVDRCRDRTARLRRRRRVVGRRLSPGEDDRLEPARPADRRRRDGGIARAAAAASSPRGAASGSQRAGPKSAVRRTPRHPETGRFVMCFPT